jgi:hypothetical protein
VKIHTLRLSGDHEFDMGTSVRTPEDGVFSVLKYELCFGGKIKSVNDQVVVIHTPIFSKTDVVTVTVENEEERRMLFTALRFWLQHQEAVLADDDVMKEIFAATEGLPLAVVHGTPFLLGERILRRTLLSCMGLGESPEIVKRLQKLPDKDIVALGELVREGHTWEEALSLCE